MENLDMSKKDLHLFKWSEWFECPYQHLINKRNSLQKQLDEILKNTTTYELFAARVDEHPELHRLYSDINQLDELISKERKNADLKYQCMKEDPAYKDIFEVLTHIAIGMNEGMINREIECYNIMLSTISKPSEFILIEYKH